MSRAYRVRIKGSVHRVVHVEDGVCVALELLPIVSKERTQEILAAELATRGFVREGSPSGPPCSVPLARRDEGDNVVVEVNLETGTVSVKAEATADIKVDKETVERLARAHLEQRRKVVQERLETEAKAEADEAEREARSEVAKKLEKRLGDLRRELDAITSRVTAEALKEKARSLGEIEEMHEDVEAGELTITVRL